MKGVLILVVVLAAATAFGLVRRHNDGRMRSVPGPVRTDPMGVVDDSEPLVLPDQPDSSGTPAQPVHPGVVTAAELGGGLGERATLLQFSSAFCQPCRATRVVLAEVAATVPGVRHVEIDAESHLELVRELDITRTPTVLVLDSAGRIRRRATGAPRKPEVLAALGEVV